MCVATSLHLQSYKILRGLDVVPLLWYIHLHCVSSLRFYKQEMLAISENPRSAMEKSHLL